MNNVHNKNFHFISKKYKNDKFDGKIIFVVNFFYKENCLDKIILLILNKRLIIMDSKKPTKSTRPKATSSTTSKTTKPTAAKSTKPATSTTTKSTAKPTTSTPTKSTAKSTTSTPTKSTKPTTSTPKRSTKPATSTATKSTNPTTSIPTKSTKTPSKPTSNRPLKPALSSSLKPKSTPPNAKGKNHYILMVLFATSVLFLLCEVYRHTKGLITQLDCTLDFIHKKSAYVAHIMLILSPSIKLGKKKYAIAKKPLRLVKSFYFSNKN